LTLGWTALWQAALLLVVHVSPWTQHSHAHPLCSVKKSGAVGAQLAEAQAINKSLSALGNVISALATEQVGPGACRGPAGCGAQALANVTAVTVGVCHAWSWHPIRSASRNTECQPQLGVG
jgi:hypothetical protein